MIILLQFNLILLRFKLLLPKINHNIQNLLHKNPNNNNNNNLNLLLNLHKLNHKNKFQQINPKPKLKPNPPNQNLFVLPVIKKSWEIYMKYFLLSLSFIFFFFHLRLFNFLFIKLNTTHLSFFLSSKEDVTIQNISNVQSVVFPYFPQLRLTK